MKRPCRNRAQRTAELTLALSDKLLRLRNALVWCAVGFVFLAIFALAHHRGLFATPERPLMADLRHFPTNYSDLSPDQFVDLFDALVFRTEAGDDRDFLYRWEEFPIKYHLIGEIDQPIRERFQSVFEELMTFTPLEFEEVDEEARADMILIFDDTGFSFDDVISSFDLNNNTIEKIKQMHNQGSCWFLITYKGRFNISGFKIGRTLVFVNAERPILHISHCIYHEIAQSLGIVNDLIGVRSVFSEEFLVSPFTEIDQSVIRALYSEQLHSGMARPAVLDAVREWFIMDQRELGNS